MTTKRIRCSCGRVYDPVKHAKCPDCGSTTVIAAPSEPPPPPPPATETSASSPSIPPPQLISRRVFLIGAGVFAFLLLLLMVRGCGGDKKEAKRDRHEPAPASDEPSSSSQRGEGPSSLQPRGETKLPDIGALIANAGAGATVKVPAGVYRGGLVAARAVRIVGDSKSGGQVVIQTEGKEGLSVRSKGVTIQNVQFMCDGIGELPAISVGDGGELEMDGCKVQSSTAVAVSVNGNASLKASGSTFAATNGTAMRLNQQARGNFTQCSFSNARTGLALAGAAVVELRACAFEGNGANDVNGAIVTLAGANTSLTADDCHFTDNAGGINVLEKSLLTITNSPFKNNGQTSRGGMFGLIAVRGSGRAVLTGNTFESNRYGVIASEKGTVEMQKCSFNGTGFQQRQQIAAGSCAIAVIGEGSSATVRNTVITDSTPYGATVFSGGTLNLEDVEIYGARGAGLIVGDPSGPLGRASAKRCKFNRNNTGIGLCAGGVADIQESECRENNNGVLVVDKESRLNVAKTAMVFNKDHGLGVSGDANAIAVDCEIKNNQRGAQSGVQRKSAQRASLTLENCRLGGNSVFGAGACAKSELVLRNCNFDGTDKTNIYKESGAVVQSDAVVEASPAPDESEAPSKKKSSEGQTRKTSTQRQRDEEAERLLRRFFPGRRRY